MRTDPYKSLDTGTAPGFSSRLFKRMFGFHNQDCSPPVVLKDQIIYLNSNIALYFTSLSCGYKLAYDTSTRLVPVVGGNNDSAYNVSTVSFNSTDPINLS
jgi:hypothetical protein